MTLRRRHWVVLATLLVGTVCLALTLRLEPGDDRFIAGSAGVAVVWTGGALLAGPLPDADRARAGAAAATGVLAGLITVVVCLAGGFVVAALPALRDPAEELLAHAGPETTAVVALTLVNAVAEEIFFRGALFDALPARLAVPVSTGVYVLTTVGSAVVLLSVAALVLGTIAAVLRRRTGGILAPIALHVTWSTAMLLLLPSVLASGG